MLQSNPTRFSTLRNDKNGLMTYPYASFWTRVSAFNVDFTILILVLFPFNYLMENNLQFFSLCGLVVTAYHLIFEGISWGATPGKRIYGLKVVNFDGSSIGFYTASLRIILKFLSAGLAFFGFILIVFHPKKQGLHDLVVGTLVMDMSKKTE